MANTKEPSSNRMMAKSSSAKGPSVDALAAKKGGASTRTLDEQMRGNAAAADRHARSTRNEK
jgi:hypothetical protein